MAVAGCNPYSVGLAGISINQRISVVRNTMQRLKTTAKGGGLR